MSIWTHVNGNIRYDYIPLTQDASVNGFRGEIEELYGEIIEYDHVGLLGNDHSKCPASHIPCGSEGSIEYTICEASRGYNVSIYGDLRNYDENDHQEIIEWFKKIVSHNFKSYFTTREAVLHIYTDPENPKILLMDWSDEKYRIIKK